MARIPTVGLPKSLERFYAFLKAAPNLVNESEAVTTSASASTVNISVYETKVTTGATESTEDLNVGDGTGAIVGQRKLITLETRTHASDSVVLDHANFSQAAATITGIALDAAGEFILVEWQGSSWEVIAASTGVVTTS